jgi:hypothetical protein
MSKFLLTVCALGLLLSPAFAGDKTPEQLREENSYIFGHDGLQKHVFTRYIASGKSQRIGFFHANNPDCSASGPVDIRVALALLGLGDLPPVVLKDAAVTRIDVGALGRLAASPLLPQDRTTASNARYCCTSSRGPAVQSAAAEFGLTLAVFRLALRSAARRCAHAGQSDCAADGDLTGCDMTGFPDY